MTSTAEERDQRRLEVAEMLTRRLSQRKMAQLLKVTQTTIARDVKAVTKAWMEDLQEQENRLRAREAQSLNHMEMVAQLNLENALRLRVSVEEAPVFKVSDWERYDRAARGWFEKRIQLQERRAKLLNLDAQPNQTNVQVDMPISFITVVPPDSPPVAPPNQPHVIESTVVDRHDD